jgi:hypothetical protein
MHGEHKREFKRVLLALLRYERDRRDKEEKEMKRVTAAAPYAQPKQSKIKDEDLAPAHEVEKAVRECESMWYVVSRAPQYRFHSSTYRFTYHALVVFYRMRTGYTLRHNNQDIIVVPKSTFLEQNLPNLKKLSLVDSKWECSKRTVCNKLFQELIRSYNMEQLQEALQVHFKTYRNKHHIPSARLLFPVSTKACAVSSSR